MVLAGVEPQKFRNTGSSYSRLPSSSRGEYSANIRCRQVWCPSSALPSKNSRAMDGVRMLSPAYRLIFVLLMPAVICTF